MKLAQAHRLGPWGAGAAATATGVLFALAHPPLGAWPLALPCLTPLLVSAKGRGPRARVALGALAGSVAAILSAVGPAAVGAAAFLGLPLWQGLAITLVTGTLFGVISFGSFALLAGDPARLGSAALLLRAGLSFAAAEWLRATLLTGLPWMLLAHALAPAPILAGIASLGGVPLLSALLGVSGALALAVARPCYATRLRALVGALAAVALGAALAARTAPPRGEEELAPGALRIARGPLPPEGALRVALVQPALPMHEWGDASRAARNVGHLIALSTSPAVLPGTEVVIWPENALPVWLPANHGLVDGALEALRGRARFLLLGAPRYDPAQPGRRFNSALLYRVDGTFVAAHDKVHLLPFFEYLPRALRWFGSARAGLTPGERPVPLPLDDTVLGGLICYEVLFPAFGAALARDGAGVLVNLSNDAWFAGAGGAAQHFAAAALLAAAQRRPLLRATPTGVTAGVDAAGRVVARLPADLPGVLALDVRPSQREIPAARLGDALGPAALIAALALLAAERAAARADLAHRAALAPGAGQAPRQAPGRRQSRPACEYHARVVDGDPPEPRDADARNEPQRASQQPTPA